MQQRRRVFDDGRIGGFLTQPCRAFPWAALCRGCRRPTRASAVARCRPRAVSVHGSTRPPESAERAHCLAGVWRRTFSTMYFSPRCATIWPPWYRCFGGASSPAPLRRAPSVGPAGVTTPPVGPVALTTWMSYLRAHIDAFTNSKDECKEHSADSSTHRSRMPDRSASRASAASSSSRRCSSRSRAQVRCAASASAAPSSSHAAVACASPRKRLRSACARNSGGSDGRSAASASTAGSRAPPSPPRRGCEAFPGATLELSARKASFPGTHRDRAARRHAPAAAPAAARPVAERRTAAAAGVRRRSLVNRVWRTAPRRAAPPPPLRAAPPAAPQRRARSPTQYQPAGVNEGVRGDARKAVNTRHCLLFDSGCARTCALLLAAHQGVNVHVAVFKHPCQVV